MAVTGRAGGGGREREPRGAAPASSGRPRTASALATALPSGVLAFAGGQMSRI